MYFISNLSNYFVHTNTNMQLKCHCTKNNSDCLFFFLHFSIFLFMRKDIFMRKERKFLFFMIWRALYVFFLLHILMRLIVITLVLDLCVQWQKIIEFLSCSHIFLCMVSTSYSKTIYFLIYVYIFFTLFNLQNKAFLIAHFLC